MAELVAQYRRNAEKCLELVQNFNDPEAKRALLVMANAWLVLAAQREKNKTERKSPSPAPTPDEPPKPPPADEPSLRLDAANPHDPKLEC